MRRFYSNIPGARHQKLAYETENLGLIYKWLKEKNLCVVICDASHLEKVPSSAEEVKFGLTRMDGGGALYLDSESEIVLFERSNPTDSAQSELKCILSSLDFAKVHGEGRHLVILDDCKTVVEKLIHWGKLKESGVSDADLPDWSTYKSLITRFESVTFYDCSNTPIPKVSNTIARWSVASKVVEAPNMFLGRGECLAHLVYLSPWFGGKDKKNEYLRDLETSRRNLLEHKNAIEDAIINQAPEEKKDAIHAWFKGEGQGSTSEGGGSSKDKGKGISTD